MHSPLSMLSRGCPMILPSVPFIQHGLLFTIRDAIYLVCLVNTAILVCYIVTRVKRVPLQFLVQHFKIATLSTTLFLNLKTWKINHPGKLFWEQALKLIHIYISSSARWYNVWNIEVAQDFEKLFPSPASEIQLLYWFLVHLECKNCVVSKIYISE